MSDAIAIDTQRPWHHPVHKWPLSSVRSESKGGERAEEYTNPAPRACFEHTAQSQHGQWCQLLSHRGTMGKTGVQQAVASFSTSSWQNGTLMTITSWATSLKLSCGKQAWWGNKMRACVAYNLGFKWILTEVCNKIVMLAKMLTGFIKKLKKGLFQWCEMFYL